jgi:hypothetical protein
MGLRGAFVIVMLAALPAIASESGSDEAAAAWKRHEVDFLYSGFTTRYSCGGLRSKVKLLLKHLGALPDIKITERGCDEGRSLVAQFPRLKVAFYAPELPASGARDVGEPVLGVWKAVTIKRNSPRGLDMGDCELVELFRDRIMPKFLTRKVQGDINCIPHQLVGNRIDLRFEVLTGIEPVDTAQAQAN